METQSAQASLEDWAHKVEELLLKDDGPHKIQGGVRSLYRHSGKGHLLATAQKLLSADVKAVAILVGSPNASIMWPPTDTDGPGGAFAVAQALQKLGRRVVIITDKIHHGQVLPALKSAGLRLLELPETEEDLCLQELPVDIAACVTFPNKNCWRTGLDDVRLQKVYEEVDMLLNVGRLGPGKDGLYRAHDRANVTIFESHFDRFFAVPGEWISKKTHPVLTAVIGELGNEMGMGDVKEAVKETVEHGSEIACVIPADLTIIASTVNWGAWALCAMLAVLAVAARPNQNAADLLPQADSQQQVLHVLVEEGARCGVSWAREEIIDNMEASRHWDFIDTLRQSFSQYAQSGSASGSETGVPASGVGDEKARTGRPSGTLQDSSEAGNLKSGGHEVEYGQTIESQENPPTVMGARAAS
ncbi:upf0317 protein c14orf159 mitochondrial isoform x2 [Cystoisospora suis]|uniref:Upf0317 protein c14orf159 mitochondrial isoform x2 n=1 Tax=Cystoisospora suis TaxID=483139 RepID=A0A2C6L5K0_9APIC|nr:upf0317 protein c14orf159 mitochondrial isoform x2 [Cystoisospora suis]